LSRRLAAISLGLAFLFIGARVETARRPQYGGTLRLEIGATVNSLDPLVPSVSPAEKAAKDQLDALLYDRRDADDKLTGAGPFRIGEWGPGKHLMLLANVDCPAGRPFVDSIEIQMGRAARDRLVDLELNKTDFAEIPPELARRAAERGVRVSMSQPEELLALAFIAGRPPADDAQIREAIAHSIDRAAIVNFLLQKVGEPAGGLLPQWSSGTAFLFPTARDLLRAKEQWSEIAPAPKILLGYDSGDALEQSIAERIAVNAREAGITLATQAAPITGPAAANVPGSLDARLIRIRMVSPRPAAALRSFLHALGPTVPTDESPLSEAAPAGDIYTRERAVLESYRIIPLVRLPQVYGLGARVRDWKAPAPGEGWPLAEVWLERERR
jgi:ABC-type transport system substrate-binding protein